MTTSRINVALTGAAGQIAYALLPHLCNGSIFPSASQINLCLLDIPSQAQILEGVKMELIDCCYDCINSISCFTNPFDAFMDADVVILVGALPRRKGMERSDLLKENAPIFREQGQALNKVAKESVKVLVVGNPANTNAYITSKWAVKIPRSNFSALTRLDECRSVAMLAEKLKLSPSTIKNLIVWGNHSSTQFPDISHARIDGVSMDAREKVGHHWYSQEYIGAIQGRGSAVIKARGLSSALSAAHAIALHLKSWLQGTAVDEHCSMAIYSGDEGCKKYGVPPDLFCSMPVHCHKGKWTIVDGLECDEFSLQMIAKSVEELIAERKEALDYCPNNSK